MQARRLRARRGERNHPGSGMRQRRTSCAHRRGCQALSAGGWSADSPQARQAERETWNSLNASARQKAASERLKEIAASAQERYAREQAVRTARLPGADTLESRLEQAARERYQAEADIQRYSGLGLLLSPGGITENAGRLQEAVRTVEPAKERQEALRKDFDAVRSRDYNREQENQINEWIHAAPAGQGAAPGLFHCHDSQAVAGGWCGAHPFEPGPGRPDRFHRKRGGDMGRPQGSLS